MFFKRLEIVGFKSFATKTQVDFLPGTTIIVGPNGCGKSNILDSIKWVLGNQSAKSLRGSKMMDVIFAGSASFKPLGVAQVTLTIDNSRRWLDIDYDEVQITRRLFRTGESEYQLNKVVCRLRDIHDLFLGTGVGTSSYSILEQGKIDQIVNAKPEERRFIFEEAAGISKYKARKLEALRKLERTATDLKRLQDLISEVDRQVASLKRQASKAEAYKRLSAELRQGEMQLIVTRSSNLREQIKSLDGEIAELQDRSAELRNRFAESAAVEQERKELSSELETTLSRHSEEMFQVTHRIKDLEHQAGRAQDRINNNQGRLDKIEEEFAQFDAKAREFIARRDEVAQRIEEAGGEQDGLQGQVEEQQGIFNDLRGQVNESTRMIESLDRELTKVREKLSHCENVIRLEEAYITQHEQSLHEADASAEQLLGLISEYGDKIDTLRERIESLAARIEETHQTASSLQIQYAESRARIQDLNRELEQIRRDLHQRQARLATLKELKSNFEGFFQGVREFMKAAGRGEMAGVVGPVVNLVKTKGEHELALEAALGGHLQDIVLETTEAALAGLDFLAKGNHGRVTFLPLDRLVVGGRHGQLDAVLAREGVVGHASKLVEHEAALAPIVDALLGEVVLVKDLEIAEALSKEFSGLTYVALNGQVIRASGAMVGGNLKTSGLLGREREIAELTDMVESLAHRQDELQNENQRERELSETLSGQLESAKATLNELRVEKAGLDKEHDSVARVHGDSEKQLSEKRAQIDKLTREIEAKRQLKSEMETERLAQQRALTETAQRLESTRDAARNQNEQYLTLGAQLADLRAKLEKTRERLVHLEAAHTAAEREIQGLEQAREARRGESARLEEDSALARTEIDGLQERLEELFARRDELDKSLSADKAQREELTLQIKRLNHELEQLSRDERAIENNLHDKQTRHAALQGNYGALSEQCREKFERDLDDIASEIGEINTEPATLAQEVTQLRQKLDRMGAVNLAALDEFNEQSARLEFLTGQEKDLVESKTRIEESIAQLDEKTKQLFHDTFESIRGHFIEMFRRLFNGGKADLVIDQTSADPLLDGGIEIMAQPPGKKLQSLTLMSGGEKAMTAVSLLFALFLHKPAPFCILDEIDAPLDDANVERFKSVVMEFNKNTQFVIITHNKLTMELADAIYGVTMEESGVSKLVSVRFEHAAQLVEPVGG